MFKHRDNLFLIGNVLLIILWVKFFHKIPKDYFWFYILFFFILIIPFFYLISLKRKLYQWSFEAIFYLIFLTFLGIIAFSHSIMGINPFLFFR